MLIGKNSFIAENAEIGKNVVIGNNVIIQENVKIGEGTTIQDGTIICANSSVGDNSYLDFSCIIRENVSIGDDAFIGARCILGEYLMDFITDRVKNKHKTTIGRNTIIRSETIIYGDNIIGDNFQTGHRATIREKSVIGHNVRIGTLSDIQGDCQIGNYVNMHSNVHIGQKSLIKDFVWIFPYVVLTNDPNPPSEQLLGVTVEEFAVIATGTVVLPGKVIGKESLVGAGATVTKDVPAGKVVVGNPIKVLGEASEIRNKITGEAVYPWKYHFDRGMPWKGIGYEEWAEAVKANRYQS